MRKIKHALYRSSDGEHWVNFGELAEIIERESGISPEDLWKKIREQQLSSGGLIYTTAGLIRFNAERESPESIHTDFRFVFIQEVAATYL